MIYKVDAAFSVEVDAETSFLAGEKIRVPLSAIVTFDAKNPLSLTVSPVDAPVAVEEPKPEKKTGAKKK